MPRILLTLFVFLLTAAAWAVPGYYEVPSTNTSRYRITIVDDETSRGIPYVRVRTTDSAEFWSDSAGVVAYDVAGMMDKLVFFQFDTPGYSLPKDGMLPVQGFRVRTTPGRQLLVRMKRNNIAQRLYRLTGSDIYRDSILLGDHPFSTQDDAVVQVTGQDSVQTALYKGRMFWLWGDTKVSDRQLGNYKVTSAWSDLPDNGGLDPEIGVRYSYIRAANGHLEQMVNMEHEGPIWCWNPMALKDSQGQDRLVSQYVKVIGAQMQTVEKGYVIFNDETQRFDQLCSFPLHTTISPEGCIIRHRENGVDYIYFCNPWPNVRVPANLASIQDLNAYEAFTCFKEGTAFNWNTDMENQIDRDTHGNILWGWKKNTSPSRERISRRMFDSGLPQAPQYTQVTDIEKGSPFSAHFGSIAWNPYRNRWTCIRSQSRGDTYLGEIFYLEADTPLGPWVYGQKIVTHKLENYPYTFYNPYQHPEFQKENGRKIYFEATYTDSFSGTPYPTPRYDYNQIMYSLDLSDPRIYLPVPVYKVGAESPAYRTHNNIPSDDLDRQILCFAPDRQRPGTVPVYEYADPKTKASILTLTRESASVSASIAFYALPPDGPTTQSLAPCMVALNEFVHKQSGRRIYSTEDTSAEPGYLKSPSPVCFVWKNPLTFNPFEIATAK